MARGIDRSANRPVRVRRQLQTLPPFVQTIEPFGGTYVIQHWHHTRDVDVYVYSDVAPYDRLNPRVQHTTHDTVTLIFGGGLPTNPARVKVSGL